MQVSIPQTVNDHDSENSTELERSNCQFCMVYMVPFYHLFAHTVAYHGHELYAQPENSYKCQRCRLRFPSEDYLTYHLRQRHHTTTKSDLCRHPPGCGVNLSKLWMAWHTNVHALSLESLQEKIEVQSKGFLKDGSSRATRYRTAIPEQAN